MSKTPRKILEKQKDFNNIHRNCAISVFLNEIAKELEEKYHKRHQRGWLKTPTTITITIYENEKVIAGEDSEVVL